MAASDRPYWGYIAASALTALVPFVQMTALGGNSQLLQAIMAPLNFGLCLILLPLIRPDGAFWRKAAWVIVLLLAALAWALLPELAGPGRLPGEPVHMLPDLGLSNMLRYLAGTAALLAGAMVGYRRGAIGRTVPWFILFGALNLAIGLMARADDPDRLWGMDKTIHHDRFTGTLLNGNAAAAVFGLLAILAVGQALVLFGGPRSRSGNARSIGMALSILAAISCLLACVITASRSALVLTLGAIFILLIMARLSARTLRIRGQWLAVLAIVTAAGAWIGGTMGLMVMERFAQSDGQAIDRVPIWQHYWDLVQAAPAFGYGLGSFTDANLAHLSTVRQAYQFSYIHAAHNHALQLLLAAGWPFLLLHIIAIALIIAMIVRTGRREFDPHARAIWLGLLIVLTCSMVDIALTVPAIVTLCALLLGLLWGRAIRRGVSAMRSPKTDGSIFRPD
ncbi:O-antigen ligase family protein [Sphingobium sp.]|uniref:O-antigen ligase family protein n=1 Tax=Sphingobium sp. TaxID=1912891 RepID=UPI003B3B1449